MVKFKPANGKGDFFNNALGPNIQRFRKNREWSQVLLAKKLGYESTGTMSLIENQKRGMSLEKIAKAARLFGINPGVLMSEYEYNDDQIEMIINFFKILHDEKSTHSKSLKTFLAAIAQKPE